MKRSPTDSGGPPRSPATRYIVRLVATVLIGVVLMAGLLVARERAFDRCGLTPPGDQTEYPAWRHDGWSVGFVWDPPGFECRYWDDADREVPAERIRVGWLIFDA